MYMNDLLSLLKLYTTLVNQEMRTSKAEDLVATHAYSAPQLISVEGVREHIEDLVRDDERGAYDSLEDPDDAA